MTRTPSFATAGLGLVLLGLTALACAGPVGPDRPASDVETLAFGEALSSLPENPALARQRLEAFLAAHPTSPLADDAGEKIAALALAEGKPDEATRWLEFVLSEHGREDRADAARVTLAGLARDRGDDAEARRVLRAANFDRLDASQRVTAYRMMADLSLTRAERLRWLGQLYGAALDDATRERVESELDVEIAPMAVDEIARFAPKLDGQVPAARLRLRLAERALDAGDVERAQRYLDDARSDAMTLRDEALRRELSRRLEVREQLAAAGVLPSFRELATLPAPRTTGAEGAIGVVLPLSGAFARYGEESLRGILLAADIFDEITAAEPADQADALGLARSDQPGAVRVLVRDSAGEPRRAAEAVRELASRDDVVGIVGPLLAGEAEAAAAEADAGRVPLLTLTSREDVASGRSYVFRLRTTPADEVRFLVDHAVDALGAKRFAVLYPADTYGRGMRSHFWRAVEERGGYVVAASSYEPGATDFAGPIRRMIGYALISDEERAAVAQREERLRRAARMPAEAGAALRDEALAMRGPDGERLPPIVDFDALFIPDSYEKVVLIAPQLAFHDVTGVRLLGSSGWADPDLVEIGRNHVRGAVIAALFHAESQYTFVSDFVDRYKAHYDAVPDVFAASAYDAANLVLVQLAAGHESRREVRDGIAGVHGYPGASGVTSFLADGNARKRPFLLGVRGRRIVQLD